MDKRRISLSDHSTELWPLRRAEQLTRCSLYWIPVSAFPIPSAQKEWLTVFIDRFSEWTQSDRGLRAESFLQMKTVHPALLEPFIDTAHDFIPVLGLSQRPGKRLPPIPTMESLQPIIDGKRKFDFNESVGDYCYWFVDKDAKKQRELFFGYGGMTTIFLTPDPKTKVEPLPIPKGIREHPVFADLFKRFSPDLANARAHSLADGFRRKSLDLFAGDLKKDIQSKGIPFSIPLLYTRDFFDRPEEEFKKWFELFDLYISESPQDEGILLASKLDVEQPLVRILKELMTEGLTYPSATL